MIIIKKKLEIEQSNFYLNKKEIYTNFSNLFLDIETTGLNQKTDFIRLIGFMLVTDELNVFQIFAQKNDEEKNILNLFNIILFYLSLKNNINDILMLLDNIDSSNAENFILNNSYIYEDNNNICNINFITYNGNTFDINFLNKKFKYYNLKIIEKYNLFTDIYKCIKNTDIDIFYNKKLKNVEYILDIKRKDNINVKNLIRSYTEYEKNNDIKILNNILLHNYEDVYNLYYLLNIIKYLNINKLLELGINFSNNLNFIYKIHIKNNFIHINGIYNKKISNYINLIDNIIFFNNFFSFKFNIKNIEYKNINLVVIIDDNLNFLDKKIKIIEQNNILNIKNIESIIENIIMNFNI